MRFDNDPSPVTRSDIFPDWISSSQVVSLLIRIGYQCVRPSYVTASTPALSRTSNKPRVQESSCWPLTLPLPSYHTWRRLLCITWTYLNAIQARKTSEKDQGLQIHQIKIREDIFSRGHVLSKKCPLEKFCLQFRASKQWNSFGNTLQWINIVQVCFLSGPEVPQRQMRLTFHHFQANTLQYHPSVRPS